jgi:hypothetical protein
MKFLIDYVCNGNKHITYGRRRIYEISNNLIYIIDYWMVFQNKHHVIDSRNFIDIELFYGDGNAAYPRISFKFILYSHNFQLIYRPQNQEHIYSHLGYKRTAAYPINIC